MTGGAVERGRRGAEVAHCMVHPGGVRGVETETDQPDEISRERLGEPERAFRVGAARFGTKFGLGALLVVYGVVANVLAWRWGFWGLDHVSLLLLFAPPITGLSILRQLYINRGLAVLIYPTGLLRIQGREVLAFPWDDIRQVRIRAERATPLTLRDGEGRVFDCRLVVASPVFRLGSAAVLLTRGDGQEAQITPALAGYPELVEEVLSRTFAVAWPRFRAQAETGALLQAFGAWSATGAGLSHDGQLTPWAGLRFVGIADSTLTLEQPGRKPDRLSTPLEGVSHPHLLIAYLEANSPAQAAPGVEGDPDPTPTPTPRATVDRPGPPGAGKAAGAVVGLAAILSVGRFT